jgi:hypothetical protein
MPGFSTLFFVVFVVIAGLVVAGVVLVFVARGRQGRRLAEFARQQGFSYEPRPAARVTALAAVLEANVIALAGDAATRPSDFSDLLAGSWKEREFRFFRYTRMTMHVTSGTARTNSAGMGSSSIDELSSSTTSCLQVMLRRADELPDLWVKKHSPLDIAYRLTGLRKLEPADDENGRRFRAFCRDPDVAGRFLETRLLSCLEELDPSEFLQLHGGYLLLTSRVVKGEPWIEARLPVLARVADLLEKH